MRRIAAFVPLAVVLILVLSPAAGLGEAEAQTCGSITQPPWPDGCSLGGPLFVQNGLNLIFLGACNAHDQCWAQCNGPNPPYLGLGHKAQCDLLFLAQMETACVFWSGLLSFPGSGWVDADDFLDDCSAVAGAFFAAVNTPVIAFNIFWGSQCCRGCNTQACANVGLPRPPLCGWGQCWGSFPRPPRPPIPFPCVPYADTTTWVIDERGAASPAPLQLDFDLARHESRPESTVYLEEWAVLPAGGRGGALPLLSSAAFGQQVEAGAAALAPPAGEGGSVLVVEAANHAHNARYAPVPTLDPFAAPLGVPGPAKAAAPAGFWFRAEVSAEGAVDQVALLDASTAFPREAAESAIRGNLRLRWVDERRHRSVVYGRGTVATNGLLEVESGLVVISMCCHDCCWDPEFQDWICPCW